MSKRKQQENQAPALPAIDREQLVEDLKRDLRRHIFENSLCISIRRVTDTAEAFADAFACYLQDGDEARVSEFGSRLALEGLGYASLLAQTFTIWRFCGVGNETSASSLLPVQASTFTRALIQGYTHSREENILREQQLTYQAVQRARQSQEEQP